MNPYRDGRYVAARGSWWRFRLWLAQWIVPSNEGAFLDRWDVTDDAKRLALAWDRGHIGRVEWNPDCMGCGVPAPLEDRCRECGSRERNLKERVDILKQRIAVQQHLLEYVERHNDLNKTHDLNVQIGAKFAATDAKISASIETIERNMQKMPKAPPPTKTQG